MAFWPFVWLLLNSCLGDPATQLTMANQAGVVVTGYGPGKAIYTKGDVVSLRKTSRMPMWKTENVFCLIIPSITGSQTIWGQGRIPVIPSYYL